MSALRQGLLEAAFLGNAARVESLLREGAESNAVDENGWSAMMAAAGNGRTKVVECLLGAQVLMSMLRGLTMESLR